MVDERQFRADLFYRLSVFPIEVPPLRERHEDIRLLVRHFAMDYADRMRKSIEAISEEFMAGLVRYPWPGNIPERSSRTPPGGPTSGSMGIAVPWQIVC
jgi:transcriptional regulator with GAF, ATPase, and Fis domain